MAVVVGQLYRMFNEENSIQIKDNSVQMRSLSSLPRENDEARSRTPNGAYVFGGAQTFGSNRSTCMS
jgi:hypothetical protein